MSNRFTFDSYKKPSKSKKKTKKEQNPHEIYKKGESKQTNNGEYFLVPSGDKKSLDIEPESTASEDITDAPQSRSQTTALFETSKPATDAIIVSPFWITFMGILILIICMNVAGIVLASLSIENANNIGNTYNTIKKNIQFNNFNENSDCITCDLSGDPDGSYTSTLTSIMNNNFGSVPTGFVQFSPNGIELDNILFTNLEVSSSNSNTKILFENDFGASENLFASIPGLVTIPQSTLNSFQLTQYCSNIQIPILFTIYNSLSTSFDICVCNNLFQKCVNLS